MKRLLVIVIIISLAMSGCISTSIPPKNMQSNGSSEKNTDSSIQYASLLTLNQVKDALKAEGLQLQAVKDEKPDDYRFYNASPAIFTIKQNEMNIMIYTFESIAARKEVCERGGVIIDDAGKFPKKKGWFTRTFTTKNVLIGFMINTQKCQADSEDINQAFKALQKAVFRLNDAKRAVFASKGQNWDARLALDYFEYWYKDDEDASHIDRYAVGKWQVKYLGPDPESIHEIKYEYKNPSHGGSGTDFLIQKGKDYYLNLGNVEGNLNPNAVFDLIIQWEGHQESLKLKKVSSND